MRDRERGKETSGRARKKERMGERGKMMKKQREAQVRSSQQTAALLYNRPCSLSLLTIWIKDKITWQKQKKEKSFLFLNSFLHRTPTQVSSFPPKDAPFFPPTGCPYYRDTRYFRVACIRVFLLIFRPMAIRHLHYLHSKLHHGHQNTKFDVFLFDDSQQISKIKTIRADTLQNLEGDEPRFFFFGAYGTCGLGAHGLLHPSTHLQSPPYLFDGNNA